MLLIGLTSLISCQQQPVLYQKSYTQKEKEKLAISLLDGLGNYYQGTPAQQFLIKEALQLNPNHAEVWREMGVPYLKRGFTAEAMSIYYPKAVELDPVGWQGWRGYLYLYFYRDYKNALADFDATDTLTPNFVDYPQSLSVDFMRGICYLKMGQYQQAINYFDQHIEYEKGTTGLEYIESKTFLYKGIAHLELMQKDQARAAFELGLTVDPTNADLLFWLAKLSKQVGDQTKAQELISAAKTQFLKGNYNHRPYVEEFFQTYLEDLEASKK